MKNMKINIKYIGFLCVGILFAISCVDEKYDMNKDVDKNITLFRNVTIPVGDLGSKTIGDILKLDNSQHLIKQSENGDYYISVTGKKISYNVETPEFTIPAHKFDIDPMIVSFPTSGFKYSGGKLVSEQLVYSELTGSELHSSMNISFDTDFPSEIIDVRNIDADSDVSLIFTTNVGKVYAKKGCTLTLPDNLCFAKVGNNTDYTLSSAGNVLVLDKDIVFSASSPYVVNLKLDSMTVPAGTVSDGKIVIDEEASFNGDFYLFTTDFSTKPSSISIYMDAEISDIEIESFEAKFNIEHNLADNNIIITDIPKFLKGDNFILDFYNPTLMLNVTNSTPLSFELAAELVGWSVQGAQNDEVTLNPFGSDNQTLSIPANTEHATYIISRRPIVTNSNVTNIVVPPLHDLVTTIPENIELREMKVSSYTDDYVTINADQQLATELEYEINVPLAFGENLELKIQYDLLGMGLVFDGTMKNTIVSLDFVNSIPLSFRLSAVALDTNGNVVKDMDLSTDYIVAAGTHLSPTSSTIKINVENSAKKYEMDAIRFTLSASYSEEHAGIALNKNQGVKIENVSFAMPEGIEVEL